MKKLILLLPLVLCLVCSSLAQKNTNMNQQIQSILTAYLDAGDKNNVEELDKYMHANFRVTVYDGKEDVVKVVDRATYRMLIENKTFGGYARTIDYHGVQFIGDHMATVQVTLTSEGKPTLKNFFSLAKSSGKWAVVQDFVTLIP